MPTALISIVHVIDDKLVFRNGDFDLAAHINACLFHIHRSRSGTALPYHFAKTLFCKG
jgi:hypothetical protein